MLKALMGLAIAGVAALAIASPAAAAPVCNDDDVIAYGGSLPTFAGFELHSSDYCDGSYTIISVNWSPGSGFIIGSLPSSTYVYLDGVYYWTETAVVTVSDGTDTDEFTLTVYPCFEGWTNCGPA